MRPSSRSPSGRRRRPCPLFQAEIAKTATIPDGDKDSETAKDRLAERQARAAIALVRLGKAEEVWPLLRHSADPRLRSFIVNWLSPLGADPKAHCRRTRPASTADAKPTPAQGQQTHGRDPVPPRDLDAAGADPGPGDLRAGRTLPRRAGAADRQAARPLPQRPRRRHPRGGRMDAAAMEAAGEAQGHSMPS